MALLYGTDKLKEEKRKLSLRPFFAALFPVFFLITLFFVPVASKAQVSESKVLILGNEGAIYDITPFVYITPNLESNNLRKIINHHLSGLRGKTVDSDILLLGSRSVPYWIIFSIGNQTNEEDWILSFGEKLDGRIGTIQEIFLYENTTKTRYIDTVSPLSDEEESIKAISGTTVRLKLGKQSKSLFAMYIVPKAGMPFTFTPYLMTEETYLQGLRNPFSETRLMNISLLLVIVFFLAALVMRQMWSAIFIIIFYALQLTLYNFQNTVILGDFFWSSKFPGILFNISLIMIFMGGRHFLNLVGRDDSEGRVLLGITITVILSCILGIAVLDTESVYHPVVLFAPGIACVGIFILLCIVRGLTTSQPVFLYTLAWLFLFTGASATFMMLAGWIEPSRLMMNTYWYSLIPQAIFLVMACIQRYSLLEYRAVSKIEKEREMTNAVSALKQSKETAENIRLLKVIEHERQVMNELREREIKQNEDMREAVAAADEANRSKSAFLAVVSHEIRTPMTGIMGMVRLLLDTQLDKKQRDYAQTIMDSGDAMMALLNDILDFEKIESGRLDLEYVDFDLHRILNSVITLMSGHAEAKKIYLKLDLDPQVPQYFVGDPVRLRQVLLNLCGNSIKFTEQGGVTVKVQIDNFGEEPVVPGSHKLRFSIEDTGIGISQEAQKNLFNPFSQADSSITRKFGGTGLGLAICQRLIETMGDRIRINSTEGEGSTFYFTIVMKEGSAEEAGQVKVGSMKTGQHSQKALRILVVEDNEINQKLLKEFLERMGHSIKQVMTGEDAVDAAKAENYDVVLMDIELPGISGMGATKSIRAFQDKEKAVVPVIALTGNVRDEDVRACYAANMNGHIAKPIDPGKLKAMLEKVDNGTLDNPVVIDEEGSFATGSAGTTEVKISPDTFGDKPSDLYLETDITTSTGIDTAEASQPWKAEYGWERAGYGIRKMLKKGESGKKMEEQKGMDEPQGDVEMEDPAELSLPNIKPATGPELSSKSAQSMTDVPLVNRYLEEDVEEEDSFASAIAAAEKDEASQNSSIEGTSLFDQNMLDSLKETIEPVQFRELLDSMMEKADEIIMAVEKAWHDQDILSLAARGHELKGMSGNFGLSAVSVKAKQVEMGAKENKLDDMEKKIAALITTYKESKAAIENWLAG